MQIKSRGAMGVAVSAVIVIGVGAGVAIAQSGRSAAPSPSLSTSGSRTTSRDAYVNDVANRAGVDRSSLDAALRAQALDNVTWVEDNGFITKTEADDIRSAIKAGDSGPRGPFGFRGPYGPGFVGFPLHGLFDGGFHHESDDLTAAASYLGLTTRQLADALATKTLAQVAADQGKPVDGLKQALRAAHKAQLDGAVSAGDLTGAQENALLARFDAGIDDVVNSVPPSITDLARRLGIDRAKLISAIKGAAIDQVDEQLAQGLISKPQADEMKKRIESRPALPLGGFGPCGGFGFTGRFGPGFRPGFGPGRDDHADEAPNADTNVSQETTVTL